MVEGRKLAGISLSLLSTLDMFGARPLFPLHVSLSDYQICQLQLLPNKLSPDNPFTL